MLAKGEAMNFIDPKPLRERINAVYSQMQQRAKPKKWKTGKRAGTVRKSGLDGLPFTRQQLWDYAVAVIGPTGAVRCPYCEAIGRPAFVIDLTNIVFDHFIPVSRGGTYDLDNIRGCCADCNRIKGELSYEFFVAIMAAVEKWEDARDRSNFHACLRTHGVSVNLRFKGKPKEAAAPPPDFVITAPLPLEDPNW